MDDMTTEYTYRRENLRRLIEQWDGPSNLANKLGYTNASFLVQMAGPNPIRDVSERTARKIEGKLDLPRGYLDRKPAGGKTEVSTELVRQRIKHLVEQGGIVEPQPNRLLRAAGFCTAIVVLITGGHFLL